MQINNERGWSARSPHVKRVLGWLKTRYDAGAPTTTEELVEWDRQHGRQLFNWNDAEAAQAHRLHQARNFMERFDYRLNGFRVRGWYSVSADRAAGDVETPSRSYYPAPAVIETPTLREKVIIDVTRRLETQAATLRFLELSQGEIDDVLARVERALSTEIEADNASSITPHASVEA